MHVSTDRQFYRYNILYPIHRALNVLLIQCSYFLTCFCRCIFVSAKSFQTSTLSPSNLGSQPIKANSTSIATIHPKSEVEFAPIFVGDARKPVIFPSLIFIFIISMRYNIPITLYIYIHLSILYNMYIIYIYIYYITLQVTFKQINPGIAKHGSGGRRHHMSSTDNIRHIRAALSR